MVVDVGLPSPMEAPVSAVIGTGTGTRITDVEVVVSDSAGGQVMVSYADGWISALADDEIYSLEVDGRGAGMERGFLASTASVGPATGLRGWLRRSQ